MSPRSFEVDPDRVKELRESSAQQDKARQLIQRTHEACREAMRPLPPFILFLMFMLALATSACGDDEEHEVDLSQGGCEFLCLDEYNMHCDTAFGPNGTTLVGHFCQVDGGKGFCNEQGGIDEAKGYCPKSSSNDGGNDNDSSDGDDDNFEGPDDLDDAATKADQLEGCAGERIGDRVQVKCEPGTNGENKLRSCDGVCAEIGLECDEAEIIANDTLSNGLTAYCEEGDHPIDYEEGE